MWKNVPSSKKGKTKRVLLKEFREVFGKHPRKWIDKQAHYFRDDTKRCTGCKLLFANLNSYLDHALWCEKLSKKQKLAVRNGELIQKARFMEMMKHAE